MKAGATNQRRKRWMRFARRPSPAMVVAIIALVVACAGSAGAASLIVKRSSQVAKGAINSGDLANNRGVEVVDLTPAARAALTGATGPAGRPGPRGERGPAGSKGEGGALAFARVEQDGTHDPAFSRGVLQVTAPITDVGAYCFDLDDGFTPKNAVATIDYIWAGGDVEQNGRQTIYALLPINDGARAFIDDNCPEGVRDAEVIVRGTPFEAGDPPETFNNFPRVAFWIAFN